MTTLTPFNADIVHDGSMTKQNSTAVDIGGIPSLGLGGGR